MSSDPIEPYDALRSHGPDVFTLDGDWEGTTFRRRMTILRLGSGALVIHNPIRLRDADYAQIDALGPVSHIVAPNMFHGSDSHHYRTRYPGAKVLASAAARKAIAKLCPVDGVLPRDWDPALREEIDCLEFEGTRWLAESVFLHRRSRTLVVTDLVFHMQTAVRGLEKLVFRWNRIYKRFGPSNVMRYVFVNDRRRAGASLRKILEWDFDRVVMNHGDVLETGGKERLRRGFEEIGIK